MKPPRISGKLVVRKLQRVGFRVVRQRGSHVRLVRIGMQKIRYISVPLHKELKTGMLLRILKDAGLTVQRFRKL